jgi:hypothetical protein
MKFLPINHETRSERHERPHPLVEKRIDLVRNATFQLDRILELMEEPSSEKLFTTPYSKFVAEKEAQKVPAHKVVTAFVEAPEIIQTEPVKKTILDEQIDIDPMQFEAMATNKKTDAQRTEPSDLAQTMIVDEQEKDRQARIVAARTGANAVAITTKEAHGHLTKAA